MDKTSTWNFPCQEANDYLTSLRNAVTTVTELSCSSSNFSGNAVLIDRVYNRKLFVCVCVCVCVCVYMRCIYQSVTLGF
jgi:hypothetical protein